MKMIKKMQAVALMISIILLVAGCGALNMSQGKNGDTDVRTHSDAEDTDVNNSGLPGSEQQLEAQMEKVEGDFIYRLVSEKSVYEEDEPLAIHAELEYIGEDDQVDIYHAASPFYFPISEITRGYEIGYVMDQPLIRTTLVKGVPLRESYTGSGWYSEQDPPEYLEFIKQVMEGRFPEGKYTVNGYAGFYVEDGDGDGGQTSYRIEGSIGFEVVE
jgi:hypothetical protein